MPRAPFNTTAAFYNGPLQASPGSVRFSGPARLVMVDGVFLWGANAPSPVAWVTTGSGMPVGAWTPGSLGLDPRLSDLVAIPDDAMPRYWVLWTERVIWRGADYFRGLVADLPAPAGCGCGGPPPPPPYGSGSQPPIFPSYDNLQFNAAMLPGTCTDCNAILDTRVVPRDGPGFWFTSFPGCGGMWTLSITFDNLNWDVYITGPAGNTARYIGPWSPGNAWGLSLVGLPAGSLCTFPSTAAIQVY